MIDAVAEVQALDPARSQGLKDLMISSTGFAFDPRNGLTYTVNSTGADIIRWLNEGLTTELLIDRVQNEYDVDGYTARRRLRRLPVLATTARPALDPRPHCHSGRPHRLTSRT